jgi:Raf kinase inhibitor-like YbhB/YbcL family protein
MDFLLTSSAFDDGQPIPRDHTGDGADESPPLSWVNTPQGTVELALICEDPDAPNGDFVHWVVYGMPAGITALKRGVSPQEPGFTQGRNDFGRVGYRGPAPPPGKVHHYHFRLMALDQATGLGPNADKRALRDAVRGHILAEAKLTGTYQR